MNCICILRTYFFLAMEDRQQEMINDLKKSRQKINSSNENLSNRIQDESVVEDVTDRHAVYAVFVSYTEVYNEKIYDLLEKDARSIAKTK